MKRPEMEYKVIEVMVGRSFPFIKTIHIVPVREQF